MAVTAWWLLARGGILVIERDFTVPPPVTPRK
jgi:hypothetical protein